MGAFEIMRQWNEVVRRTYDYEKRDLDWGLKDENIPGVSVSMGGVAVQREKSRWVL